MFLDPSAFDAWATGWHALCPDAGAMDAVNPAYIPRNHLVEEALTAATEGDLDPLERLLDAVTAPVRGASRAGTLRPAGPRSVRGVPDVLRNLIPASHFAAAEWRRRGHSSMSSVLRSSRHGS